MSGATSVSAEVRYLNPEWKGRAEAPRIGDRMSRRANTAKRAVSIGDARGLDLGLDTSGFVLARHESAVRDFHDAAQVRDTYYREVGDAVRTMTGADAVFVYSHTVRTEDTSDFNVAYARFVHCDYSLGRAAERRENALAKHKADLDPARHWEFAWFNTWQPIEREVRRNPLAVIDARTLDLGDVIDYYYTGYQGRPGPETGSMEGGAPSSMPIFRPEHRFYYFSRMRTDEMMVIKQLDTRPDRARGCPHTSFDIEAPADAPGRRSIEVRMACAFAS